VSAPTTWHHGLVAEWWALFNTAGDEIAYFQRFVDAGQPALDAGCGRVHRAPLTPAPFGVASR
jgi:hypothetical protein